MKCPVCTKVHSDRNVSPSSCSHGALVVYTSATCPICLDDQSGPPMVALPCGHLLCKVDFGKLGGYIRPLDSNGNTIIYPDRYGVPEVSYEEDDDDDDEIRVLPSFVRLMARQRASVAGGWDLRAIASEEESGSNLRGSHNVQEDSEESSSGEEAMLLPHLSRHFSSFSSDSSDVEFLSSSDESSDWCEEELDEEEEDTSSDEDYWDTSSDDDYSSVLFIEEDLVFRPVLDSSRNSTSLSPEQNGPAPPAPWPLDVISHLYENLSRNRRKQMKGGAWLLVPIQDSRNESMLVYSFDGRSYRVQRFARASRLILDGNHGVFVYSPCVGTWVISHANLERLVMKKYEMPPGAQIVSDGHCGVWALHGNNRISREKQLLFCNFRCRQGRKIRKIPCRSYLISDTTGGVWIHVREQSGEESSAETLAPGLWHFTTRSQEYVSDLHKDTRCIADGKGSVWTLSPPVECPQCHRRRSTLSRVCDGVLKSVMRIHVASDAVKLISDGKNGVYIHDLDERRWKLYHWSGMADDQVKEVVECPRDAKIASDGDGGAWMLFRKTRTYPFRSLVHVTRQGRSDTPEQAFRLGTLLTSA